MITFVVESGSVWIASPRTSQIGEHLGASRTMHACPALGLIDNPNSLAQGEPCLRVPDPRAASYSATALQ